MQEAVYYSSNGGASEDSLNVWGNDVGYLKGKIDPYEGKIASIIPRYNWSTTFTASELTTLLNNRGYGIGTVKNAYVSAYTDTGNVYSVTFTGTSGSKTVSREGMPDAAESAQPALYDRRRYGRKYLQCE